MSEEVFEGISTVTYRLRTLGGLSLSRANGAADASEGGVASQRKALALLAILAAGGAHGVSRDRLLLLLWPESDSERGRGALKTMVHALRRQLGADAVVGVADLRLGAGVVSSDLETFRAALAAGDDAAAVAACTGPFLDGIYVEGAPEFERWAGEERSRVEVERRDALDRLAARASQDGRWDDAVRWWRARHAADPLHAPTSLRLMHALVAAGDRDGALLHARAHESLVRAELDVPPNPDVMRLAESLRTGGASGAGREGQAPEAAASVTATRHAPRPPETPSAVVSPSQVAPAVPVANTSRALQRRAWLGVGGLVVAAAIVITLAVTMRRRAGDAPSPASDGSGIALRANRVAVAVFVNRTGDRALDALGTMVADWITRGLVRTPAAEVFDVGGLFLAGRAPDGAPVEPRQMAQANGAGLVVAGNYYKVGERITFSVQVLDVASGRVLRALEPVDGEADRPLAAVDEVRQRVASALATILDPRMRQVTTPPLVPPRYEAYTEFAAGQEVYWRGDWDAALPHFRRAVALDSSFAAALAYLSVAAVGTGRCALVDSVQQRYAARSPGPADADWLTVQVSTARCGSDHETHNRLVRERLALIPGSRFSSLILSTGFRQLNRPGEALAILADIDPSRDLGWLPLRGRAFYWRELAANHHLLRDYRAEREVAVRMQRANVAALSTGFVRARALAALGHGDSALAVLDSIATAPPDPALVSGISGQLAPPKLVNAGWVMEQVALELAAHGDSARGRDAMARAARWFATASRASAPLPFAQGITHARILDALGRGEEARAEAEALVRRDSTSIDARGTLGIIAARSGDLASAATIDQWLAARPHRFPLGLPVLYRAQIAAARGDSAAAIALLGLLPHAVHPLDVLHFHVDPALAVLRASAVMQRWLVPRG